MGSLLRSSHHVVVSLEAIGGFLDGVRLELVDGLNCLIGGRGAGKTTALEFLRFGLGLMPDIKDSPERARDLDRLIETNLKGHVTVEVRTKNGMRYSVSRPAGGELVVRNEAGTAVPVSLKGDLFSVDIFSQNEIEEIAVAPRAQLALLDRFVDAPMGELRTELDRLTRELGLNAAALLQLDQAVDALRGTASELAMIEEKLKGAVSAAGPDAQKVTEAHAAAAARVLEAKLPGLLLGDIQNAAREFAATAAAFKASADSHLGGMNRSGLNRDVVDALETAVSSFSRSLIEHGSEVEREAVSTQGVIREQQVTLSGRHAKQDAEYATLSAQLTEEGDRATERRKLQQSRADAFQASKELEAKEKLRADLLLRRSELISRISELRDRRFEMRKGVATDLTERFKTIRVTITQSADTEAFRALLADKLRGARIKWGKAAEKLVEHFPPHELSRVAETGDHGIITKRTGFDEDRSKKIVDALREGGARYEIEAVDLDDLPLIELQDGGEFKASPNLSTGQRCTSILPILLVQSERPLLVDQPEDNLDNAFIFANVVKALESVKGTRQVVFVTHNPNIPVLGEADRVFVFESDGRRAKLRRSGSVDECKADIESILEGGREAFLKRKVRYGH